MNSFFARMNPFSRYGKQSRKLGKSLDAESRATMAGLRALQSQFSRPLKTAPNLRRGIHVLEKGLCFPDRKKIFGVNFIGPAVTLYAEALSTPEFSESELKWASDVISRYFKVVDHENPAIKKAHEQFSALPSRESSTNQPFVPYPAMDIASYAKRFDPSGIDDLDQFHELCRNRRSHRHFKKEPIPLDTVRHAITAALESPSACNRQPFDYYIATESKMIQRICKLPLGVRGYGDQLPALIVVVGNLACYDETRDRHLIYIDAALATMTLMLALTAAGLGSVPINWPDLPKKHQQMRKLLNLSPWQVPVMLVGLGVPEPETMIAYSSKRKVDDVLHHVTLDSY